MDRKKLAGGIASELDDLPSMGIPHASAWGVLFFAPGAARVV